MVEIFRTDVISPDQASKAAMKIYGLLPQGRVTFDLEDCDRILRVEGENIDADSIVSLMQMEGHWCEILS